MVLLFVLFFIFHALKAEISTSAKFFVEHAHWRGWKFVSFHHSDGSVAKNCKIMSDNFIFSQKAGKLHPGYPSGRMEGRIYLGSNFTQQSIGEVFQSTPVLIFQSTGKFKDNFPMDYQSSLNIASELVLAHVHGPCPTAVDCDVILDQVYKVGSDAPLTVKRIGKWTSGENPSYRIIPPEIRAGSKNVYLRVGIKNFTFNDDDTSIPTSEAEKDEEIELMSLIRTIFSASKFSYEFVDFPKLGWRSDQGGWTHLLGAISDGSIHLAADTVDLHTVGIREHMALTNPIIRTQSAVYLQHPDGVRLGDIVLSTFSPSLQISVVLTALLFWLAMLLITVYRFKGMKVKQLTNDRIYEPTEALLWIISVLCMQGSSWAPKSLSGCVLLLFSLLFALITYNSFAAFVTSILSINANPFRSIEDLLKTGFVFGYVQESPEEHFLRTVDNQALRSLYYRGLIGSGKVDDVETGMTRAANSPFVLFTSARLAHRTLNSQMSSQWRCRIMEMPVPSTKTASAIPLASNSPYNPIINYWLIRMQETGILARMRSLLSPPMPKCISVQRFKGASLDDLRTAYGILVLGMILSVVVLVTEILWDRKRKTNGMLQPRRRLPRVWHHNEYVN